MVEMQNVADAADISVLQGVPKKMSHSVLKLKSVVEVRFYFSTCVSESEF